MARQNGSSGEFRVVVGDYVLGCVPDGLPLLFNNYVEHAQLAEQFAIDRRDCCCVSVRRTNQNWPFLVVAQSFYPAGGGFEPGLLLIPSTERLFIGAGERVLAYDLQTPHRLWSDSADTGFWGWAQHGDTVVMSGELELAAWTTSGKKLWTAFVEPPWDYKVEGETVHLDVMGVVRSFPLRSGPQFEES